MTNGRKIWLQEIMCCLIALLWFGVNSAFCDDGPAHVEEIQEVHPTLTEIGQTAKDICQSPPLKHTERGGHAERTSEGQAQQIL
jgi:hypothetical protein